MTNHLPKPIRLLSQAEINVIEMGLRTDTEQRRVAALARLAEIEERTLDYDAYIASPEWRARSAAIKERDGYRCRLCGGTQQLEVHHSTYERLGHELDTDLITLDHAYHSMFHQNRRLQK